MHGAPMRWVEFVLHCRRDNPSISRHSVTAKGVVCDITVQSAGLKQVTLTCTDAGPAKLLVLHDW